MPTSSQKTRRQTSRALHVDKPRNLNWRTHLHQTQPINHQPLMRKRNIYLNRTRSHGIGEQGASAAKRKYYLPEEVRHERLTEGGDFVLSRRSAPLSAYKTQARNFAWCLDIIA